ncbi:MAG: heavy-metal-associated domain-containing protein [Bacteroidales bacterium]|jgi:copper chaperone CopZ|nr:heavy-metal-associated domain-containing protein [Bacteroidales bacterium]MDD3273635.1 heavy-metal-associated domain-containing protein [Bacteroidales bacterium]MDD4058370.1 heavy-metal-associated domain-containing protein [Bacteroidales bacterium]
MKRIKTIILAVAALILVSSVTVDAQNKKNQKNEVQITLSIPDLDCPNCVKKIEAKMPYEKGVRDLKVSLEDRTIWISFEEAKTNKDELAKALEKLGFPAKEIEKK